MWVGFELDEQEAKALLLFAKQQRRRPQDAAAYLAVEALRQHKLLENEKDEVQK